MRGLLSRSVPAAVAIASSPRRVMRRPSTPSTAILIARGSPPGRTT
jgi:hypothetical protein